MDEATLRAALLAAGDEQADRLSIAAGAVVRAYRDAAPVDLLVVSGGAAVAIYTGRDFATRDIDFVTLDGETLDAPLRGLGFDRRDHRQIWEHSSLGLVIQVVASHLPPHSETTTVDTSAGPVALWSATDLVIDRLANVSEWRAKDRLVQALALRHAGDFDVRRGRQRAADDGIEATFDAFMALAAKVDVSDEEGAKLAVQAFWTRLDAPEL